MEPQRDDSPWAVKGVASQAKNSFMIFRRLLPVTLIKLAVSPYGTESLAQPPATMTHADAPAADHTRMGIEPVMVRLSVGVEHFEDIVADIEQALRTV